jgi:hypothetical protein
MDFEESFKDWELDMNPKNPDLQNREVYDDQQTKRKKKEMRKKYKPEGRAKELIDILNS